MTKRSFVCAMLVCLAAHPGFGDDEDEPIRSGKRRAPWTTSRITGSPTPPPPFVTKRLRSQLAFDQPVEMVVAPGESRPYVVERKGRIVRLPADDGAGMDDVELVLDGKEAIEGLTATYGLAFHPDYERNRLCYVCYILKPELPRGTRVSRFEMTAATDDAPARIDPATEAILLEWKSGGHNGGSLKFGPDRCLYISTGDGSPPSPPDEHDTGQDIADLEASVLRIDVDRTDGDRPYATPKDNPFLEIDGARPEVWAYGFRNPWRMSFDRETGDLWLGDVGWQLWEMVYRVERGGNYGWSVKEGPQTVRPEATHGPTPILPPTRALPRADAASVTGGFVYRGRRFPDLVGSYVYGDYVTGKLWALRYENGKVTDHRELTDTRYAIICFFEDHDGEIAFLDYNAGTIHELVPNPTTARESTFPTLLSETGLFSDHVNDKPAVGVARFEVNVGRWMDGARAVRFVGIPGEGTMTLRQPTERVPRKWGTFPADTVLAKTISIGEGAQRRRLETQILHFNQEDWRGNGGEWVGYTYVWNEEQTDATLAPAQGAELEVDVNGEKIRWRVSSRTECYACHNPWAGYRLGFTIPQLDMSANLGGGPVNQLEQFERNGYVALDLPAKEGEKAGRPEPFPNPYVVEGLPLDKRARAYLHVNCAHCHRFGGGGTATIQLTYDTPIEKTNALAVRPTQGSFGLTRAEIIAPGDPFGSVLLYRMATIGRGRMPHVGSREADPRGLALIRDWIAGMKRDESMHGPRAIGEIARVLADVQDFRSTFNPRERLEFADQLLSDTRGALALANGLHVPASVVSWQNQSPFRDTIVARARERGDAVGGLFEGFLPPSKRPERLGSAVDPAAILARTGDPAAGRKLLHGGGRLQCINCHRIGEVGGRIGPDLTRIGKDRTRAELLASILEPSARIDPRWRTWVVETKRGRVHTGLLVERSDERIVLRYNPNEKDTVVKAADVEQIVPTTRSLMPDLLFRDMTAEQLADLLAYLDSLE